MSDAPVTVTLRQRHDYQFDVRFGEAVPDLLADEPPPLGQGAGPSPVQLLGAAVGNCLSDSLLFALRKYRQAPEPLAATVAVRTGRNAAGRVRVLGMDVELRLGVPAASLQHLERALSQFEDFCTVTQSVAQAFPVAVRVVDADGARLHGPTDLPAAAG